MLASFYFSFYKQTSLIKGEKIFYLVFIEIKMYGPRQGPRPLSWAKCQNFLETIFICHSINKNLNKNFQTYFQTFILFFSNFCDK